MIHLLILKTIPSFTMPTYKLISLFCMYIIHFKIIFMDTCYECSSKLHNYRLKILLHICMSILVYVRYLDRRKKIKLLLGREFNNH